MKPETKLTPTQKCLLLFTLNETHFPCTATEFHAKMAARCFSEGINPPSPALINKGMVEAGLYSGYALVWYDDLFKTYKGSDIPESNGGNEEL